MQLVVTEVGMSDNRRQPTIPPLGSEAIYYKAKESLIPRNLD